jgi:transketolase
MSAPAPSMLTPAANEVARSLGLRMGRPNLDAFAETLTHLARADRNVIAVTSDSRGSGKLGPFGAALPKQIVEVGIAEQNLVGIAAGLASAGKTVFAVSPACFLAARALEQIKNDVCYSDMPVKLIAISAGVSYGALGTTHHSLHDIAALRAINNIDIVVPADNFEAAEAIRAAGRSTKPIYVRFGKAPLYDLSPSPGTPAEGRGEGSFAIGRSRTIRPGRDLCFIATGETVIHALLAAEHLKQSRNLACRVISMHTIEPLDTSAILSAATECAAITTVEEHMTAGGLGEAVASTLLQAGVAPRFRMIAIPDEYTVTGSQADIFRHYGISMEGLSSAAVELL